MSYSTAFFAALGVLLLFGTVYGLIQWRVQRALRRQQRPLEALYSLAETVVTHDDSAGLLERAAEIAPRLASATHCSIWIFDHTTQQFECEAATEPHSGAISLTAMSGVVTCFRNQATTEVPDAENCPFVAQETVRRFGQKALLYLPIEVDGECLGVLELEDRRRKRLFRGSALDLLGHLVRLVALALRQRAQTSINAELHRSEKVGALSELVEGISEELISPLGRIVALAEPATEPSELRLLTARLNAVGQEAHRASEVLSRIVRLVRPGAREVGELDLIELVEGVAGSFKQRWKRKALDLRLKLSKAESMVIGDATQLEEAFRNILLNAERMVEQRGVRAMEVYSHVLDKAVLISMAPADLHHVSELPEEQESYAESDGGEPIIGLAVCQILIEKAGANMRVHSGQGPVFSIEVEYPLAQPGDLQEPLPIEGSGRPLPKSMMILVIDNDAEAQDSLLYHLAERGHRVIPVPSLEEGLDLSQRVRFDWVFCNVQMGRKSALDVYRLFQSRVRRFIFLADEEMVIYNQDLFSGQDRAVLRKPVKASEIDRLFVARGDEATALRESATAKA